MFKQFLPSVTGAQVYLVSSLLMFLVFFIVVAVLLVKMRRAHVGYMSSLPLTDDAH